MHRDETQSALSQIIEFPVIMDFIPTDMRCVTLNPWEVIYDGYDENKSTSLGFGERFTLVWCDSGL